jgi:capsular polysaccharide biosynthesis protein
MMKKIKCRILSINGAIQENRVREITKISPDGTVPGGEFFVENYLPFSFGYFAHAFLGPAGLDRVTRAPCVSLLSCSRASVVARDAGVMVDDTGLLDVHTRFLRAHRSGCFFERVNGEVYLKEHATDRVSGTYFLGFTSEVHNYAHWMTETLPFLPYYANVLKPQGVRLVLGQIPKYYQGALALYGIDDSDIFHMPLKRIEFEQLLLCSPTSLWSPPMIVRETALDIVQKTSMADRGNKQRARIYLSRQDASRRRLLNENRLIKMLECKFDFAIVRCSELSFVDQVRTLRNAEVVVGPHGAALANVIFCTAGASLLELFPEFCLQPEFRALAARAGARYGFLQGTTFEYEDSRETRSAWGSDFIIDISLVEKHLQSVLS